MKFIVTTIILTFAMSLSAKQVTSQAASRSNTKDIELIIKDKAVLKILNGDKIVKITNQTAQTYRIISFGCDMNVVIHNHANIEILPNVECPEEPENPVMPPTLENNSAKNILMVLKDPSVLKSLKGAKISNLENYSGDVYGISYNSCIMFRSVNTYVTPCEGSIWDCPRKTVVEPLAEYNDCMRP